MVQLIKRLALPSHVRINRIQSQSVRADRVSTVPNLRRNRHSQTSDTSRSFPHQLAARDRRRRVRHPIVWERSQNAYVRPALRHELGSSRVLTDDELPRYLDVQLRQSRELSDLRFPFYFLWLLVNFWCVSCRYLISWGLVRVRSENWVDVVRNLWLWFDWL